MPHPKETSTLKVEDIMLHNLMWQWAAFLFPPDHRPMSDIFDKMVWNFEDVQDNFILKCMEFVTIVIVKVVKLVKCPELFEGQQKHCNEYIHFQIAVILTIWELTLKICQCHVHTNKVKGQGYYKMLCYTALWGWKWLYIHFSKVDINRSWELTQPYFQGKCHSTKVKGRECLKMPCCTMMGYWVTCG